MPDEQTVVWPEDPLEADARAAEAEPEATPVPAPPAAGSSWPATFEEALKESQAAQGAPVPAEAQTPAPAPVEPGGNEYPTQHAMPAIPAKTVPPAARAPETTKTVPPPVKTAPSIPVPAPADEPPTGTLKTESPTPEPAAPAPNGQEPVEAAADTVPPATTGEKADEADAAEAPQPVIAQAAAEEAHDHEEAAREPEAAPAPEAVPAAEMTMVMAPESLAEAIATAPASEEPEVTVAPEPSTQAQPAIEPAAAPAVEPVAAQAPAPAPEPEPTKEDEWIPAPVNPPVPAWAPKLAPEPVAENVEWPGSNLPSWAPIGGGRSTTNLPPAQRSAPRPSIPIGEALPQSKPPTPPPMPAQPAATMQQAPTPAPPGSPTAPPSKSKTGSSWEVVAQKPNEAPKQEWAGPTGEDRSYAEWFAWAKRSGAPAQACHAAAQGAFRALAAGQDMNTAVQWATLAMASPPGLVGPSRQLYCAWFSLGNIDLKLPGPQAHAFATGAIKALDGGADAPSAHQAGLAAAGITGA